MEHIYPLEESKICTYIGRPVCAVLQDGSYFYGYLKEVRDGGIILTAGGQGDGVVSTNVSKAKGQLSSKSRKMKVSAFGGYGYGYGAAWAITLPLALLALLFAFPFGFFI